VHIRLGRSADLAAVVAVEVAAGAMFADIGMVAPALSAPPDVSELDRLIGAERLWVAVDDGDRAVGYLAVTVVDGACHVAQVSIDPAVSHRGVGRTLIENVASWARDRGFITMTLTTYSDVPWNAPYYERLGWRRMTDDDLAPGLRAIRAHEVAVGLDAWPRVCMIRPFGCGTS
jgi:GNAT superfamily N-acetyltransferase